MEQVVKTLEFLAYFTCIGALVFRLLLATPAVHNILTIKQRWSQVMASGLFVLSVCTVLGFMHRIQGMCDTNMLDALPYVWPTLHYTHCGLVYSSRFILLVALALMLYFTKQNQTSKRLDLLMLLLLIAIGFTYSAVSHAADKGDFTVAQIVDWLHLLASAIWGGSILITLFIFYKNIPAEFLQAKSKVSGYLIKLSKVCAYALLIVLITGFYKLQVILSNGLPLWSTNYGQILSLKLIFVVLLLSFGAINRYVICAAMVRWAKEANAMVNNPLQLFSYVLICQGLILCIILGITTKLMSSAPAM